MSLGRGDLLLLFLLLEGKPRAQETCRAKACTAKRVSKQAFLKHIRKQICKVNRQQEKVWKGKLR